MKQCRFIAQTSSFVAAGEHTERCKTCEKMANGLGFVEGSVVKYVSPWQSKGGIEDLEKARHLLAMLIEHDRAQPNE